MGDEEGGGTGGLGEVEQLVLEDGAQLGVERRERLVHQQHLGFDGEGAGDRDPLPHSAGEGGRICPREVGEPHPGQPVARPGVGLLARYALDVEAEPDVGQYGLPVVDPVVLEDHRRRAGRCRTDGQLAGAGAEQSGGDPEQRGLAAAGRADEAGELARSDGEIDGAEGGQGLGAAPEGAGERVGAELGPGG